MSNLLARIFRRPKPEPKRQPNGQYLYGVRRGTTIDKGLEIVREGRDYCISFNYPNLIEPANAELLAVATRHLNEARKRIHAIGDMADRVEQLRDKVTNQPNN